MNTLQQQFEQLASSIVTRYQVKIDNTYTPSIRVDVIKQMRDELMALKETYAGLVEMPIGKFSAVLGLN